MDYNTITIEQIIAFVQYHQWIFDFLLFPIAIFIYNFCQKFKNMLETTDENNKLLKELLDKYEHRKKH